MGKKLDAILGRNFKTSKFKTLANLAISRLAVFKNQRQVKCNQARSDVIQLLQLGHHDRALLRVEHMIKEQKMWDVYVMMEGYCILLAERVHVIEQEKVCPGELKEAISGLLYASSRCGDFPELQEIRALFTSRYGKEFANKNLSMIQKLSTRQPDLDGRMKILKEIASENSIVLQLEEAASASTEEQVDVRKKQNQPEPDTSTKSGSTKLVDRMHISAEEIEKVSFSDSMNSRTKYRDVADAAQAAFESAAYAAAAARAAVELSRSAHHGPDNQSSPNNRGRKASDKDGSESENQEIHHKRNAAALEAKSAAEWKRSASTSSMDLAEDDSKVTTMSLDVEDPAKQLDKDIVPDESDEDETVKSRELKGVVLAMEKSSEEIPSIIQAGSEVQSSGRLDLEKGPISVRTRRVRGF